MNCKPRSGDPRKVWGMSRPFCVYNRCFSSQSPRECHIIDVIDKFAMDAKCSFSELRKSKCGDFRGSPFAVRRLLECKEDITGHLQSCHLSKLVGNVEEHDLILMRAGKFDLPTHQQECMWICPNHRYNLGRNWRPLKTCQYPLHSGARKKLKNRDVVNLQMSKNIQTSFGVTIPIGSGKRVSFNNYKCQHRLKYKWGMERPYFKKQFCRVSVLLTWQIFFFVHGTERETIDFGTPSDLRVEIFYCCCNGTVSLL